MEGVDGCFVGRVERDMGADGGRRCLLDCERLLVADAEAQRSLPVVDDLPAERAECSGVEAAARGKVADRKLHMPEASDHTCGTTSRPRSSTVSRSVCA